MNRRRVAQELLRLAKELIAGQVEVVITIPYDSNWSGTRGPDRSAKKALESIADAFGGKAGDWESEDKGWVGKVTIPSGDVGEVRKKVYRHFNPKSGIGVVVR